MLVKGLIFSMRLILGQFLMLADFMGATYTPVWDRYSGKLSKHLIVVPHNIHIPYNQKQQCPDSREDGVERKVRISVHSCLSAT